MMFPVMLRCSHAKASKLSAKIVAGTVERVRHENQSKRAMIANRHFSAR
jgi:hypothetical protein